MSWEAWLTLAVVVGMIAVLARDRVPTSVAVIGGVVTLLVAGVITPAQAFVGFSNAAPITVAALYVLARAVEKTGALQPIVSATLGEGNGTRGTLARLLMPSAAASAFLNNTPIVAMLVPEITNWSDRQGQSPSRFLMPLSYACMLGGMVTLIGTSTNLVVSGLLEDAGMAPLGMFELTAAGLPIALAGMLMLVLLSPVLLPDRRGARDDLAEGFREFSVNMAVVPDGPFDGMSVEEAGLRNLQGVFLVEIERRGELIAPVAPEMLLRGGDRLIFVGRADLVVDLQGKRGLESAERRHVEEFDTTRHTFFEAVIGATSPLVGKTLKEAEFRNQYGGAVVAIHRAGHRVLAKLGAVSLRAGDTLLVISDTGFAERWRDRNAFLLVSQLGGSPPAASKKAWIVGLIGLGIVVGAGTGILPVLQASLVGAFLLVIVGALTPGEARSSVDLDVILVIAGAFGIAAAMRVSGLAGAIADLVVTTTSAMGPMGAMTGIVLVTILLHGVITNNATAVLVFPVAISTASELSLNPRAFAVAVAISASASFLTPIAYQTNLMVWGPGGYRFGDYTRLGLPLTLLVAVGTLLLVPVFWPL